MNGKPTVLILGSSHLANPENGDLFKVETDNVLGETRQQEIQNLIHVLQDFKPTKVALEVLAEYTKELNEEYDAYANGEFELTASEHHQIGFRLAKETGLSEVEAVDWNGDVEGIPDISVWASENGSNQLRQILKEGQTMAEQSEAYLKSHTLTEFLLWLNHPDNIRKNQEFYMKMALVGDEENPAGTMWTAQYWYYRNLLIYKNIIALAASSSDRIFVLYGAGHLHLLIQFLRESGLVNVEVASDYLTEKPAAQMER
ncbi:DUF5694 domain-containing protein [Planomicrobium sp. YIM 101495]|uniref:DUF5694 domain-containing protein n=1 Tax=Planomicrobium sp. YIM 101495 TaxID=2665160 RepID=UPI0012B849F2|nr:DUF5694 domain-containing protein [Planomicrobium sp. YIM 101495]MTD31167.1 hypothetical protein [Planomicrobium sp. YIM 101495]